MSAQQSAVYGGGGRFLTNPKHLPIISAPKASYYVKTGLTSTALLSAAGGFTAMALRGVTGAIASANTFITLLNISSGSGFAFNFVSPTHDGGTHTPTIEITVDGVLYTIAPTAAQILGNRICIGPLTKAVAVTATGSAATAGDFTGPNSAWDDGFGIANVGGIECVTSASVDLGLVTPHSAMSFNMPCLRYESSLLVRMKCDSLSGTTVDKSCGVTYRPDL